VGECARWLARPLESLAESAAQLGDLTLNWAKYKFMASFVVDAARQLLLSLFSYGANVRLALQRNGKRQSEQLHARAHHWRNSSRSLASSLAS